DLSEFENLAFYEHQVYGHAFNGNIGAPVHEKLRTGAKDNFQGFLFKVFRVLKPGGWLEVGHAVHVNESVRGPALTRLVNAYASWHEKYGFNLDLILNLEDHLQMIGKAEFISSRTIDFSVRNDHFGEFSYEIFSYYIKLSKEFIAPIMGISLEEYDHLLGEIENEMKERCGKIFRKHKKVFARKKDMGVLKDA
ncbi:11962_t:CDS:2, partial [Dentiscutata erythropus]